MDLPVAQLSCQNCTRRKTKCDKQLPNCSACKKAGVNCTTVQRQRLPRGRSAKVGKTSNEQVLRDRIDRLEGIVARLQQTQPNHTKPDHHEQDHSDHASTISESFVAPDFWAELMESVAGLRSVLEEDGSSDLVSNNVQSPWLDSQQQEGPELTTLTTQDNGHKMNSCDSNRMLFGSSRKTDSINTPPETEDFLLDVYHKRVHALFPVLHWPSTTTLLQEAEKHPKPAQIRALRSAIHFTSVCSLMDYELEGRQVIMNQYRQRAEQAFIDAELLTTTSLVVLQAFVIYLAGLRACESNLSQWTLLSVAVRLASALGLGSASNSQRLSVLDRELRCRLWFSLGVLDKQSAFDRGSHTLISSSDFADWPLNIDDADISTGSALRPTPQDRFTEMSFGLLTCRAGVCGRKLAELGLSASKGTVNPQIARSQQLATLADFEASVIQLQRQCDTTPTPIQAFAVAVAQESLVSMRLLFHRPLHKRGKGHDAFAQGQINQTELLTMATEVLERSQSKRSWAQFAQWAWFKWVKWYALAVVLAELCTARGTSADHAWVVAQQTYDDYASIVADTNSGMLWRPIARLMQRARALRTARTTTSQDTTPMADTELVDIQWHNDAFGNLNPLGHHNMDPRSEELASTLASGASMGGISSTENDANVGMSWFHWDLLIDDIETQGLHLDS